MVGVAPLNQDSCQHRGKRRCWSGRADIRATLYIAALVGTKHNPLLCNLYQRLLVASKAKKSALVACMQKLIVILNAIARTQLPWRPLLAATPSVAG